MIVCVGLDEFAGLCMKWMLYWIAERNKIKTRRRKQIDAFDIPI